MNKRFSIVKSEYSDDLEIVYNGYKIGSVNFLSVAERSAVIAVKQVIQTLVDGPIRDTVVFPNDKKDGGTFLSTAQVTHCPFCKSSPCICVVDEAVVPQPPKGPPPPPPTAFPAIGRTMDIPELRNLKGEFDEDISIQLDIAIDALRDFFLMLIRKMNA